MNNKKNLLVSLTNGYYILRVAIQIPEDGLTDNNIKFFNEPENRIKIIKWLPSHCQDFGSVVEIEEIFEIKQY